MISLFVLPNVALFSSDHAALLILFRTTKSWTSPSLSHDRFFCRSCCALLSRSFSFRFSIVHVNAQPNHLPNSYLLVRGLATQYQSVLRCLRNTWHLPSGGCHAYFWTYIYPRARESQFQWYSLVWGSFRSPNK